MNKIYKVIWSKVRNCYVAVSEIAKRNGKDRTSVTGGATGGRQAARVLCALLLGAYLTAGYSMPVAWGAEAQVRGNVTLDGINSSAWGLGTATGWVSAAWGGYQSEYSYTGGGTASGVGATAFGVLTTANTEGSTAWGKNTIAGKADIDSSSHEGTYATAWGNASYAAANYATAFGDGSKTYGTNSLAALGATVSAANSAAIGKGATASLADTVALGSGAVANIGSGVAGAYKPSSVDSDKAHIWTSTRNAIAVGDAATK
ncbi:MAG: hypothetical protein J6F33_08315, partial [Acidaminococcaceae bacterium]|nr:hypothetical protein [Acidaminococcaceae bacterium]